MSVQELRARTGAGIVVCAEAWKESNHNLEAAVLILRKKGLTKADSYASRSASSGVVGTYLHHDKSAGVMITLSCETDFVARTPEFQELANNIAMHVMASNPLVVSLEDIPAERIALEQEVALVDLQKRGMAGPKMEMALKGKVDKVLKELCLLSQSFVVNDSITVGEAVKALSAKCGEKIVVTKIVKISIK